MAEANIINAVKIDGVNYAIANDDRYYTEAEIDGKLNVRPVWDSPNDAVNGGVMVCDSTYGNIKCAGNYVKSVNGSTGTVTISNATTSANGLMSASDKAKLDNTKVYNGQYIELYPGSSAGHGGYIDFHYNDSKSDYTSRIIEQSSGTLNIQSTNFQHNGLKVLTDGIIVDSYNVAVKFTNGVAKYSNSNIKANAVVMVSRRGNVAGANTSYCTHTTSGGGSVTICCSSSVNETHYLNIIISNI